VLSIAEILQVLHKTDIEEKFGKGDYGRKAQNQPEECIFTGPEIPPAAPGQNFWGPKIPKFPSLRNSAKSFTLCCGATLSKGPGNSGIGRISGAGNSIISAPAKFG
jgi:hypothetical protein